MPRPRSAMRRIKEVLRLRVALGGNVSAIAAGARVSRSSVRKYLMRAAAAGVDAAAAEGMAEDLLENDLFSTPSPSPDRPEPDWAKIDQDLRSNRHVSLRLVWQEYRADYLNGYGLSQFKHHYAQWRKQARPGLSMHQERRAGETVQVDYAGDTISVTVDGAVRQAQLFVACLPATGLVRSRRYWNKLSKSCKPALKSSALLQASRLCRSLWRRKLPRFAANATSGMKDAKAGAGAR
ncbi:hypothetical protein WCLP8_1300002 [uncultured Gammaproteobacteria bacterium]